MDQPHTTESPQEKPQTPSALEPLCSLQVAIELIPMPSLASLYLFLSKHKEEFPARYFPGRLGRPRRMLYESELIKIRKMRLIEDGSDHYHSEAFLNKRPSPGRPRTRPYSPIEYVMKRAMNG